MLQSPVVVLLSYGVYGAPFKIKGVPRTTLCRWFTFCTLISQYGINRLYLSCGFCVHRLTAPLAQFDNTCRKRLLRWRNPADSTLSCDHQLAEYDIYLQHLESKDRSWYSKQTDVGFGSASEQFQRAKGALFLRTVSIANHGNAMVEILYAPSLWFACCGQGRRAWQNTTLILICSIYTLLTWTRSIRSEI